MIRAKISEIIGDFAILEFGGVARIVPCENLPQQAAPGDVVLYRKGRMVLMGRGRCVGK